jgi:hypothetical protein
MIDSINGIITGKKWRFVENKSYIKIVITWMVLPDSKVPVLYEPKIKKNSPV